MLGKYLKIENVVIPNPEDLSISYSNTETIKQSEAATDIGIVTRLMKRTFSFSFQCSSFWRDKLKSYCALSQTTLTYNGEAITGRLRLSSEKLLKNSEYCDRTDGLWTLSVSFIEL